jgi:cytochrome c biogenesis factor
MTSAIWVGAAVLAAGAVLALLVPGRRRPQPQTQAAGAQLGEPSLAA